MTKVTMMGPLSHAEAFHVHRVGCADLKRNREYRLTAGNPPWTVDVDSLEDIVLDIYSDMIGERREDDTWENYADDVKVFPCVGDLPRTTPEPEPLPDPRAHARRPRVVVDDAATIKLLKAKIAAVEAERDAARRDLHRMTTYAEDLQGAIQRVSNELACRVYPVLETETDAG